MLSTIEDFESHFNTGGPPSLLETVEVWLESERKFAEGIVDSYDNATGTCTVRVLEEEFYPLVPYKKDFTRSIQLERRHVHAGPAGTNVKRGTPLQPLDCHPDTNNTGVLLAVMSMGERARSVLGKVVERALAAGLSDLQVAGVMHGSDGGVVVLLGPVKRVGRASKKGNREIRQQSTACAGRRESHACVQDPGRCGVCHSCIGGMFVTAGGFEPL